MARSQENLKSLAGKNTFYNYVGKVLEGVAHFLVSILLARHLTISSYGEYSLFMEILKVSLLFGGFGIGAIFLRYIPEHIEQGNHNQLKSLFLKGTALNVLLQIFLLGAFLLLKSHIAQVFAAPIVVDAGLILAGLVFVLSLVGLFQNTLTGMLMQRETNIFSAAFGLVKLIGFYWALKNNLNLTALFYVLFGTNLVYLVVLGVFLGWRLKMLPPPHSAESAPPLQMKSKMVRYGFFSYLNESSNSIFEVSTDIFIIGIFLGSTQVAQYAFAVGTIALLLNWLPTRISSQMLLPLFVRRVTRVEESEKPQALSQMFQMLVKLIGFFIIPASLGLILLGEDIIRIIFDEKFLPSYGAWVITAAFLPINEILVHASVIANLKERSDIIFISRVFIVYNLVLDLLLVKQFGIEGVALATATALLGKALVIYVWTNRLTPLPLPWNTLAKILGISLVMGGCVFGLKHIWPTQHLLHLIFLVGVGGLVFFGLCARFKIFSETERAILCDILRFKRLPF